MKSTHKHRGREGVAINGVLVNDLARDRSMDPKTKEDILFSRGKALDFVLRKTLAWDDIDSAMETHELIWKNHSTRRNVRKSEELEGYDDINED